MKYLLSLLFFLSSMAGAAPTCTQVIGYSQLGWTWGWYNAGGVFESIVNNDEWQLLWENMAGVDRWRDPNYSGWKNKLHSPCKENSTKPERVVLSVTGPYAEDVKTWKAATEEVIQNILKKLPSVKQIVLIPVVGGPVNDKGESKTCTLLGQRIRASWQHNFIVKALEQIKLPNVTLGIYPKVETCKHYIDFLGHLSEEGGKSAGELMGEYFKKNY